MAREIRNYAVLVPAGTLQAAPQVTDLVMPPRYVRSVRVRIPPGPAGTVGWALGSAGQRVIPWGAGQWIVADNEVLEWPLDGQIETGAWQLIAYNLGGFPHTLYVTFQLDPVRPAASIGPAAPLVIAPEQ